MRTVGLFSIAGIGVLTACASGPPAPKTATARSCVAPSASARIEPVDEARQSSALALARFGKRTLAYAVGADDGTLRTIDVDEKRELATTRIGGRPSEVLVTADGRVLVTVRDHNKVVALWPGESPNAPLTRLCDVEAPAEPIAMAVTPDDRGVLVTSGWGRALSRYEARDLSLKKRTTLARDPRSVVVDGEGKRAFVSHVVGGKVSVVDLTTSKVARMIQTGHTQGKRRSALFGFLGSTSPTNEQRIGCQGYALAKSVDPPGRIFAPQVLVNPGNPEQRSSGYGDGFSAAEVASIAVIDESVEDAVDASLDVRAAPGRIMAGASSRPECLLPRAAAVDAKGGSLLVTCLGVDSVIEYDSASVDPRRAERRRFSVPSGPMGIAVDSSQRRAVVLSEFDHAISVIDLNLAPPAKSGQLVASQVQQLALSRGAGNVTRGDVALGRRLFHSTGDPRISSDGRACASCHPDGREDSLTWATPGGPRQTPMLAGRLSRTAPYGWDGAGADVETHLSHTFQRLGGAGLNEKELSALLSYVATLPTPPSLPTPDAPRLERGRQLFFAKASGCAGCHGGDVSSDGKRHDVKSRAKSDGHERFDTPSLRFIAGTAPYFHDGRYQTLEQLLRESDGKMGHTAHLSEQDVKDLAAFLRTL
ncbi:MAG: c-type cytochrome [Polyangiaceae bacterium]